MRSWSKPSIARRARLVEKILKGYFPKPEIPLHHRDPFTLFVAVVLSARCTDKLVNKITPALFERAPTARELAAMTPAELLTYIRFCGLAPTKAKNLIAAAKIIVEKHGGEMPRTREELEALPGVGPKTAGVVLAQAFGIPAFPVDTHIFRSARRWGLSRGKTPDAVERDLRLVFPEKHWNELHLRILHYARGYCTTRGCDGKRCPLCRRLNGMAKMAD
jgi:endonuclease-3